jgi:hypothetical protein
MEEENGDANSTIMVYMVYMVDMIYYGLLRFTPYILFALVHSGLARLNNRQLRLNILPR